MLQETTAELSGLQRSWIKLILMPCPLWIRENHRAELTHSASWEHPAEACDRPGLSACPLHSWCLLWEPAESWTGEQAWVFPIQTHSYSPEVLTESIINLCRYLPSTLRRLTEMGEGPAAGFSICWHSRHFPLIFWINYWINPYALPLPFYTRSSNISL